MTDEENRMLGGIDGKLDSLIASTKEYREAHDRRHEKIDTQLAEHAADINKAKGAKAAVYAIAAAVASAAGAGAAIAAKALGLH